MVRSRIYHVGIVVAEVEPAMQELSDATGITWAPVQRNVPIRYATPAGEQIWDVTFVYSREAPHIELLERRDGTVWSQVGFHHLGMWSEDVDAESAQLEQLGHRWQASIVNGRVRVGGCCHLLDAASCRIELVSEPLSAPRLARYLTGGDYLEGAGSPPLA